MKKVLAAVALGSMLFAGPASAGQQDSFSGSRGVYLANGSFYNYCQGLVRQVRAASELSRWSLKDVPAPGSLGLLAVGILGAACGRRRSAQGLNFFTLGSSASSPCPICSPFGQDYRRVKDQFGLHTA